MSTTGKPVINEIIPAVEFQLSRFRGHGDLVAATPGDFHINALDTAIYPAVRSLFMGGSDVTTLNGERVFAKTTWQIEAVIKGMDLEPARTILKYIEEIMNPVNASTLVETSGGIIYSATGLAPTYRTTMDDSLTYQWVGRLWQLEIRGADA